MRKSKYRGVIHYDEPSLKLLQLLESMQLVVEDSNFSLKERREVGYLAQNLLRIHEKIPEEEREDVEVNLLEKIVESTPGVGDPSVDERSWGELVKDVSETIEGLLQEEKDLSEGNLGDLSLRYKHIPHFLRELASKWEKAHPQVECPECEGKGYRDPSKQAIKCGVCYGVGKVRGKISDEDANP